MYVIYIDEGLTRAYWQFRNLTEKNIEPWSDFCCQCEYWKVTPGCPEDPACEPHVCASESYCCTDYWWYGCFWESYYKCKEHTPPPQRLLTPYEGEDRLLVFITDGVPVCFIYYLY